jgi:hypothetical protein
VHQRSGVEEELLGLLSSVNHPPEVLREAVCKGLGGLLLGRIYSDHPGTDEGLMGHAEGVYLVGIEQVEEPPPGLPEALRTRVRERVADVASLGQRTRLREPRRHTGILLWDQAHWPDRAQCRRNNPSTVGVLTRE